jgi:hypothetical protein
MAGLVCPVPETPGPKCTLWKNVKLAPKFFGLFQKCIAQNEKLFFSSGAYLESNYPETC